MTRYEGVRWVVALPSEAAPLIQRYRMELVCDHPFKLYGNADKTHGLVVSGIGRSASAAATVFIAERLPSDSDLIFMNLGIAGAAQLELGTIWRAHKVQARSTGKVWYPGSVTWKGCGSAGLVTVEKPELQYPGDDLFDMEAAGFFEMATKFSPLELIQSLKIVSDNSREDIRSIDRNRIQAWVTDAIDTIDAFVNLMVERRRDGIDTPPPKDWEFKITQNFRFSVTQTHQLRGLLSRYWAMTENSEALMELLERARDSKHYIRLLSEYLSQLPVAWGER